MTLLLLTSSLLCWLSGNGGGVSALNSLPDASQEGLLSQGRDQTTYNANYKN
jgi:hypothetical protein